MEREVRERFEPIEALLRAGVERGNQMHAQFNEGMERAEERMGLSEKQPFCSDTKIWKLDRQGGKEWDPQIYCVPSEEFKFNNLIRDGDIGKTGK